MLAWHASAYTTEILQYVLMISFDFPCEHPSVSCSHVDLGAIVQPCELRPRVDFSAESERQVKKCQILHPDVEMGGKTA